jgi:site-specific DNA-cytosine methylase
LWWVKSRRAQNDQDYETWLGGGVVPTLNAFENANDTRATVRRLTPTECERLQGFPDGWTAERIDETKGLIPQADSHRYKQMGNAVAVPVVEWIMQGIVEVMNQPKSLL